MKIKLQRGMLTQAKEAGAINQHVNEVLHQCGEDWCSEFEEEHRVTMTEKQREKAVEVYKNAFFNPMSV